MEIVSKQTRHVFCNDWTGLIQHLKSVEWDKYFMSLPNEDEYELQDTIERLSQDIGVQAIHSPIQYGKQELANTQFMFLEGFGHFYRVDDPWNPAEQATWLWHGINGSQVYYIVIVEDIDDVEVDPF